MGTYFCASLEAHKEINVNSNRYTAEIDVLAERFVNGLQVPECMKHHPKYVCEAAVKYQPDESKLERITKQLGQKLDAHDVDNLLVSMLNPKKLHQFYYRGVSLTVFLNLHLCRYL